MPSPQQEASPVPDGQKVRKDQLFAIRVINRVLGPFAKSKPELWVQRTFLTIVARIYEHLVLHDEISPKEMADLAKAFTENCKLDRAALGELFSTPEGKNLLDGFEEAIGRLYGTNLQPVHPKTPPRSSRRSEQNTEQDSTHRLAGAQGHLRVDEQQQGHDDQPPL